jgi:serine/threonine-protein kinase
VVLHELLTGKPLFGSGAVDAVRRLQGGESVRPPSGIVRTIPRELDEVVLQSLAVEPAERFPNARMMATALEKAAMAWPEVTLEAFAERELGARREEHTAQLRQMLGGEASVPASIRPPTVVDSTSPPRGSEPTTPLRATRTERTRIPRAAWIGAPAIVALASAAVWLGRDRPTPAPPTPVPPPVVAAPDPSTSHPPEELAREAPAHEKAPAARIRSRAHVPAAAPAPAPETFGFLTVGADPYALVRLDGRQVGVTPILRLKIPTGAHKVELVQPDNGEVRLATSVSIAEGQERRVTTP